MNNDSISWFTKSLAIYFLALIIGAINVGSLGSLLKILGLIPIILWIFRYKGKLYLSPLFLSASLFLIWTAFSLLWSIDWTATKTRAMTQLSFVLLLAATCTYNYNKREIKLLKTALIWSSRISVVVSLLFSSLLHGRLWLSGVINEDPNYLCMYFLFGIVNGVEVIFNEHGLLKKLIHIVEIFSYLYVIIATGSRGGALAAGATFAIVFFRVQKGKELGIRGIVGSIAFATIAILGLVFATNMVADDILGRFMIQDVIASGGTGRALIWEDAWRTYINSNILRKIVGYGTGTAKTIASEYHFRLINVIHNIYLENLLEVGIVGAILYIIYILRFWNYARKNDTFCYSIISGLMVMTLTVSAAAIKPYWNILLFTICVSKYMMNAEKGDYHEKEGISYSSE